METLSSNDVIDIAVAAARLGSKVALRNSVLDGWSCVLVGGELVGFIETETNAPRLRSRLAELRCKNRWYVQLRRSGVYAHGKHRFVNGQWYEVQEAEAHALQRLTAPDGSPLFGVRRVAQPEADV